jgi:hypothetical protein
VKYIHFIIELLGLLYYNRGSCTLEGVDFFFFNIIQLNLDWLKNSKTKVENRFYFHVFPCGNEIFGQKSQKVTK